MMHLLIRRRRCARRDPRLAAMFGGLAALMAGVGAILQRGDGDHWPVSVAILLCIAAVGAVIVRFVLLRRNRDGK